MKRSDSPFVQYCNELLSLGYLYPGQFFAAITQSAWGCLHSVEWNGGMVECFIGKYLIIQHVLYSEQWALRCVLCMHCWLDGWLVRLVLHCMNFELWPRPGYTFTLWCMQGNQAPQYVTHSFFTYCITTIRQRKEFSYNCPGICLLMSLVWAGKSWTTTLGGMCSISGLKLGHTALTQGRLQWK